MLKKNWLRTALMTILLILSLAACSSAAPVTSTPTLEPTATITEMPATSTPTATEEMPTLQADAPQGNSTKAPDATAAPAADGATAAPTVANGAATAAATPKPPASGGTPADKYQYLGQSIADKTQLRPNTPVTITWTIKNAGTTGWTTDYSMRYFSGVKGSKDYIPFSKVVGAEKTIDLTVSFTTPSSNGDYNTWWKITNAQGQNFGDLDFSFTVTNNPTRSTSTPAK